MTQEEQQYLKSTIDNEGFEYAFESYSDFKKEVKDDIFHRLKDEYVNAKKRLEFYIDNEYVFKASESARCQEQGEAFTEGDVKDIMANGNPGYWVPKYVVKDLNNRAAEYAAGKVAGMYTEEQVREAMYHTYVNGPGHDSYADFEDGVIAKIKKGGK